MVKSYLFDKQTKLEIGQELWRLRHDKRLYLTNVSVKTKIPCRIIEGMELGKFMQYGSLRKLMDFYGKRVKVILD